MGCFGFICKHCGKNIREEELCHLIHIRDGEILGEAVGHYNSYGGVEENDIFFKDNDTINSSDEILDSMLYMSTSYRGKCIQLEGELYNSRLIYGLATSASGWFRHNFDEEFINKLIKETKTPKEIVDIAQKASKEDDPVVRSYVISGLVNELMENLPESVMDKYSGLIAYHEKCYNIAKKKGTLSKVPSDDDPNQGGGKPRKSFL